MMKKVLSFALLFLMLSLSAMTVHAEGVKTSAAAYVLYCVNNGEILLSENADEELPMASTTKIMTALLTLEEAASDNRVVEFTEEMTAEGSSMYLKRGEKVTLYDLAVGMMMQSGNDAANAAAMAISGSTEAFADRMNEKADEIGMTHTRFVTPSGLDDEDHYSCARDLALLMAYALENEDFAHITAQTSMTVNFVYPADKFITYPNHNKLLRLYDSCIGGKTGYTDRAGRCLVTAARCDGLTLIAVTLDDRDDWDDHMALYDYGFSHYTALCADGAKTFEVPVVGGEDDSLTLFADDNSVVVQKITDGYQRCVYLPSFVYAPVKKGETIGRITYLHDEAVIAEIPLKAEESVLYNDRKRSLLTYIKDLLHWHS